MKVENYDEPFDLSIKRLYLPIILTATCPECGKEVVRDLGSNYLSYPTVNKPEDIHFYCYTEGENSEDDVEHEFYVSAILRVSIEHSTIQ